MAGARINWTHKRTYAGIVIEVGDRFPPGIWKDKHPIVDILQMAAEDLRQANPVSRKHLHVVEQAPADKDGIVIVELGYEMDYMVTWSATSADAIHTARCLSQLYSKVHDRRLWPLQRRLGMAAAGMERRLLLGPGIAACATTNRCGDLIYYGADAIKKVEELAALTPKLTEIPQPETDIAEYNTIHDFLHQRLGAQLMRSLVNIGAVTTMLVPPIDGDPSLN